MSETTMQNNNITSDGQLNSIVENTENGDNILFNDRSKPLTRVGTHERERRKTNRPVPKPTIELVGNGTKYHLLQSDTDDFGPMLYKEGDWEETPDDPYSEYQYPRGGERVENAEIIQTE